MVVPDGSLTVMEYLCDCVFFLKEFDEPLPKCNFNSKSETKKTHSSKGNSNIPSIYNHIHLYMPLNGPNATQIYQIKQKQFLHSS